MTGSAPAWKHLQRRLVIFDCDGVLVDSEILACDVQARAITALRSAPVGGRGRKTVPRDVGARHAGGARGRSRPAAAERSRGPLRRGAVRPVPSRAEAGERDDRCGRRALRRRPSALRGLELVAGADRARSRRWLASMRLSGRTCSARAWSPAGNPRPICFCTPRTLMGFAPKYCVVVEDSPNGVRAARSAGMLAVGFLGGTHCPPAHGESLAEAGAQRICRDADELAEACPGSQASRPHCRPRSGARPPEGPRAGERGPSAAASARSGRSEVSCPIGLRSQ